MSEQDAVPMQTVIQINVFRFYDGQFEYLLFKRIDEDDKFWQPVTEPVPAHGTIGETVRKAAQEQIGVRGFRHLSHEMYSYEWYSHGERGRDIVFAAELAPNTEVKCDEQRFSTCAWLPITEAIERLKWDGNKEALRQLHQRLLQKFQTNPEIFLPPRDNGVASDYKPAAVNSTAQDQTLAPPSKIGVPKRLPDPPQPPPRQYAQEPNIGEWFL